MGAVTAIVPPLAILAGAMVENTKNAQRSAEQAAVKQQQDQKTETDQLQKRVQDQESTQKAIQTRDMASQRQRSIAAGAGGIQSTILTSPLGVQGSGSPTAGTKTLLGS